MLQTHVNNDICNKYCFIHNTMTAYLPKYRSFNRFDVIITVELQWLEQLRNHENMFETGVVRANEC